MNTLIMKNLNCKISQKLNKEEGRIYLSINDMLKCLSNNKYTNINESINKSIKDCYNNEGFIYGKRK